MKLVGWQKGLIAVLLLLFVGGGCLFVTQVLGGDSFNREEAQHALYALWISKDIKAADLGAFWYDTQRQMFWPFLHSWVLGLVYLTLGISYVTTRFLSLLLFGVTLLFMYFAALRFSEKRGWQIGVLAVALALTSPLMLRYSTQNSLEGLGALIFLAAFYFYSIFEESKLTYEYLILGVLIGLSIYTNYLYAYLMIPSFVVVTIMTLEPLFAQGVKLSRSGERSALHFIWWMYRKLIVLVVLLTFVATWFLTSSFSRKIMLFLQAIFRYSGGEQNLNMGQALIYYPKIILTQLSFSPWLGLLILVALVTPLVTSSYRQVNKLYVFIWTVLLLLTLTVGAKAPQLIYIILPFIFLVFSAAVFSVVERWPKYALLLAAIVLVPALISLPLLVKPYAPARSGEKMLQVLHFFKLGVAPRYPIAAAINLPDLNPEGIAFHFWDWNAPVLTDPVLGEDELFRNGQYFLSVELDPGSPYQGEAVDDATLRWQAFLSSKLAAGEVRENSFRTFSSLGLTAKIYEKVSR